MRYNTIFSDYALLSFRVHSAVFRTTDQQNIFYARIEIYDNKHPSNLSNKSKHDIIIIFIQLAFDDHPFRCTLRLSLYYAISISILFTCPQKFKARLIIFPGKKKKKERSALQRTRKVNLVKNKFSLAPFFLSLSLSIVSKGFNGDTTEAQINDWIKRGML